MPVARHGQFLTDQARGEFLLGLSDDDYLEPQFAAKILAALDRNPSAAYIQVPALVGPPLESGADFLLNHYSGRRERSWCACVTRVRDLRGLGPQPEDRIVGDMFYWTKIARAEPVLVPSTCLIWNRKLGDTSRVPLPTNLSGPAFVAGVWRMLSAGVWNACITCLLPSLSSVAWVPPS
jgi:hypothetical protein